MIILIEYKYKTWEGLHKYNVKSNLIMVDVWYDTVYIFIELIY